MHTLSEPKRPSQTKAVASAPHYLIVTVERRRYGIPASEVEAILLEPPIVPLIQAESFLKGLIAVGGAAVPVVGLGEKLGLPEEHTRSTTVVVVRNQRKAVPLASFGFLVDAALEVMAVPRIERRRAIPPGILGSFRPDRKVITLIDPLELMTADEINTILSAIGMG